jgi:hypothetical protein
MKKPLFFLAILVVFAGVGYAFVNYLYDSTPTPTLDQITVEKSKRDSANRVNKERVSDKPNVDTNDYLDQALADLDAAM